MATAIIGGMLGSGVVQAQNIFVSDPDLSKQNAMRELGVTVCKSSGEAAEAADYVFLCVKPQIYEIALGQIKDSVTPDKVIISIAAGISTGYVTSQLGCDCPVIRVMPNTPLLLSCGATALCKGKFATDKQLDTVRSIFDNGGVTEILNEDKMNEIIAVNGSSPAYVYLLAKAMLDGAKQQGIEETAALRLICQTILGSAKMLIESGKTPQQLIDMVASPGGTTLASLDSFEKSGFEQSVIDAMQACTNRANELAR